MSIESDISTGLTKFVSFLSTVLSKASAVEKTIVALKPTTIAAILATFYDVSKTLASAEAVAAAGASGDISGAITLSSGTVALVKNVITDGKDDLAALQNLVSALKADVS